MKFKEIKNMIKVATKGRPVYWELKNHEHSKFWAANIQTEKQGKETTYRLIRRWGLIGTDGQRMEQIFGNQYEAERSLDRLIWDKESKGYKSIF